MLVLAFVFMILFTVLAVQVLLWQSQDISVDIVSDAEEGSNEVTISVKNTAGTVLLFHENDEMTGKIEYLSNDGWVEYCDVYYTRGNANAVSQQYSGTFAELEPGEDWQITIPEEKVAGMQNGTYRIKLAYVTETKYKKYLKSQNQEIIVDESALSSDEESSDISIDEELSEAVTDESDSVSDEMAEISEEDSEISLDESVKEEFIASSVSEIFVKNFEYVSQKDFISDISFDERNINGDESQNDQADSRMRVAEDISRHEK
ncbi:MAG: hypothetical protein IKY21_01560 [Clostridia bacterium]|nr:hypothetical protein [Clostridia bacterium]